MALLAVSGVGVLDYTAGSDVSFAAFYVIVIVVTVVAGVDVGIVAAAWSAAVWCVVAHLAGRWESEVALLVLNGVLRFGAHVVLVLLVAALLRALQSARQSEARSRAFLADAAHQLRTPVAALSATVEALDLDGARQMQERLIDNATDQAHRLGALVASLLRIARLDEGEPLELVPTDLVALCEDELHRARQLSPLRWQLDVAGEIPGEVVIDPRATSESLWNLLDNARRHATGVVTVRIRTDRMGLAIEVVDDGPGLPSGAESRAFDRFVTLDGQGGMGLGLAIARQLARSQGGDLTYVEKTFLLTLPRPHPRPPVERGRRRRGPGNGALTASGNCSRRQPTPLRRK